MPVSSPTVGALVGLAPFKHAERSFPVNFPRTLPPFASHQDCISITASPHISPFDPIDHGDDRLVYVLTYERA